MPTMLGNVSFGELMIIMLAVLLVFGAKRIPEVARALGQGIREFKAATREITREISLEEPPAARYPARPAEAAVPRPAVPPPVTSAPVEPTPESA